MAPQVPANLVSHYAREIKSHWHKALESIFEVCALLIKAKTKLDPRDWEFLKDELPFSDSVLKKLLVIGKDPRLQQRVVYELLPPNYSIVYEVTQLTDDEIETAVEQGEISPRMRRTTFVAWRNAHRGGGNDDNVPKKIPSWVSASVFAGLQLYPEGLLPINKARKLKDELTSICKRYGTYGLQIIYGAQERAVLQKARSELAGKFRSEFRKAVVNLNTQLDQNKVDLMESALWQHHELEAGQPLPYSPERPNSIENKKHPYSVHHGWTYKSLLKETRARKIITTWTPIKDSEGLGKAKCLQLAIWYLETTKSLSRWRFQEALERIAETKSKNSKFAEQCLKQLAGLEW